MRIAVFGGSFNPPHAGHARAAESAAACLKPDRLLIIPAGMPPHKELAEHSPEPARRMELCRAAFSGIPCARVSDVELRKNRISYTVDTLRFLRGEYPDAAFFLLMGTDMLECFNSWRAAGEIAQLCTLAAFCRADGEEARVRAASERLRETIGANVIAVPHTAKEASSTEIREALSRREKPELLSDEVYALIIRHRYYGAKPNLEWLRAQSYACLKPKRVPHVQGTEAEAARLAARWGADEQDAAEAAILHDVTKRLEPNEQLRMCAEYGIINDNSEMENPLLLHAKTGAAYARDRFGVPDEIYDAIRWHTTGRAGMSLLEKIVYMADYIEPHRDFEGVDRLRALAYEDLDEALRLGLRMSLDNVRARGLIPHENSVEALRALEAEQR
jgi:nicotinate-nucleotide adenylyltransferase